MPTQQAVIKHLGLFIVLVLIPLKAFAVGKTLCESIFSSLIEEKTTLRTKTDINLSALLGQLSEQDRKAYDSFYKRFLEKRAITDTEIDTLMLLIESLKELSAEHEALASKAEALHAAQAANSEATQAELAKIDKALLRLNQHSSTIERSFALQTVTARMALSSEESAAQSPPSLKKPRQKTEL